MPCKRILQSVGEAGIQAIVLDAKTIPFIDITPARMLAELDEQLAELPAKDR